MPNLKKFTAPDRWPNSTHINKDIWSILEIRRELPMPYTIVSGHTTSMFYKAKMIATVPHVNLFD